MINLNGEYTDKLGEVHKLDMIIAVKKETSEQLFRDACEFTTGTSCNLSPGALYGCEHSPIRTQIFSVKMWNIPNFASVHFRTHKIGAQQFDEDEHFVKSNREDRPGYSGDNGRWQPVNHMMLLNAQSLISMSRRRLCTKAHPVVVRLMNAIKMEMKREDVQLSLRMLPDCLYRNKCEERPSCGKYSAILNQAAIGSRDTW